MPNNVIVYKDANTHDVSPGQIVTLGENGSFDTVTERKYFGGTGNISTYEAGGNSKPVGQNGTWICIGLSDKESLPDGAVVATITWRGLKDATQASVTETCSIKETSYDSIGNIPSAPSSAAVKANVYDVVFGKSVRSIHTTEQDRPKLSGASGSGKVTISNTQGINLLDIPASEQSYVTGIAPTYNHPWGWLPYSWQQEQPVKGIFFVSGEYRWVFEKQYG